MRVDPDGADDGPLSIDALFQVGDDAESATTRLMLCEALAETLAITGRNLWVGGQLYGPDRVEERSPFGFGNDAAVGLATIVQVGGELYRAALSLLDDENRYGCALLLRQVVEVEYLAWAFAEDPDEAGLWLRSSRDDRRAMWQPRHLRERAQGRFRADDYSLHCELGGHPTPDSTLLLPDHSRAVPDWFLTLELAVHGASLWAYIETAAGAAFGDAIIDKAMTARIRDWRQHDDLPGRVRRALRR